MTLNWFKNLKVPSTALAVLLVALVAGCSSSAEQVEVLDRDEIFDRIDQDGDGIALRADYETLLTLSDRTKVIAFYPGGNVSIETVLESLKDSPPSNLVEPENPSVEVFRARLTSMLRLRLAAVAIDEAGFNIDFDVDDELLNSQVQTHLSGGFEDWAQEEAVKADPRLEKFATPHCVTVIATGTETEARAAKLRLESGDSAAVVASEVNLAGTTPSPNGDVGCADLLTWANAFGDTAAPLGDMSAGDISDVVSMASDYSPTGRLWMIFYVRELRHEEKNLALLGPFAQGILADLVVNYDVVIDDGIGAWDAAGLSVMSAS
ncbi:MAG: hypothetical protein CL414_02285 [Acidimicrobiaceae bacterium]|nr:hypothetical protein [Acidimicrobiaceae bacterium]MEC9114936.1 hypothetical protein [Actinomycetota bacterium]